MSNVELSIALSALFVWLLHHGLEYIGFFKRFRNQKRAIGISYLVSAMIIFVLIIILNILAILKP